MTKKYDREELLTDYRIGHYTIRALANKHGISPAMVAKLTKNTDKDLVESVNKQLEARQALDGKSEQEIKAINYAVEFQWGLLKDIELFSNKTMKKASSLMGDTKTGQEFKAIIEGVDKLSILTKINDRHPKKELAENNGAGVTTRVTFVRAQKQSVIAEALADLATKLPD